MTVASRVDPAPRYGSADEPGAVRVGTWRRDRRLLLIALVAVDAVALALAVSGAGALRVVLDGVLPFPALATDRHLVASVLMVPILLLLFWGQSLYDFDHVLAGTREYARVAHAATYGGFIALAASYFAGGGPLVSRSWILLAWALTIGCVGVGRFAMRRVVRRLRQHGILRTRVVIVGGSTAGITIGEQLRAAKTEGVDLVGFLDEYLPLGQPLVGEIGVIGRPSDLASGLSGYSADEYILVPQAIPHQRLDEITRVMVSANGPVLRMAVSFSDLLTHGFVLAERGGLPLVTLRRMRVTGLEAVFKRGLDLVGASLTLIVFGPAALAALARAWLTTTGPLLYRQEVYGAGSQKITLWLLEQRVSRSLPLRGVPALLAVLFGRMSLVGPRPTPWRPGEPAPLQMWLTTVKPGITGPWRLGGPEATLADQAVQDLAYVRSYTVWEDLRIIWESLRRLPSDSQMALLSRWQTEAGPLAPARVDERHLAL